ncbi:MAG: hypothetical protein WBW48_21415 [Anaerolineae bacterium]
MDNRSQTIIGCFSIIGVIFTIVGVIIAILALVSPQRIVVVLQHILPEATPVVITVMSTPAPTLGAKPGPTLTVLQLASTPSPTSFPSTSTPTSMPRPTDTPPPTATPRSNTPLGSVLKPGEPWTQDGFSLTLHLNEIEPDFLSFNVFGENQTGQEILVKIQPQNFIAINSLGQHGGLDWMETERRGGIANFGTKKLAAGESIVILSPGLFHGLDLGNPKVEYVTISIHDLSRVSKASWRIEIPH